MISKVKFTSYTAVYIVKAIAPPFPKTSERTVKNDI